MRGATGAATASAAKLSVSIHAPHAGRDFTDRTLITIIIGFNPRAPCGARRGISHQSRRAARFQSTRPMRGATPFAFAAGVYGWFQSTRPMRGATCVQPPSPTGQAVSIHAPHAGRDLRSISFSNRSSVSIHAPHAGRDTADGYITDYYKVSIHAPHAGRDCKRGHDFPPLPRIYGYSPPQIRFSRHLRPTPLLRHDSRTYIFTFCFLFTSPSHSVMNAQMMIAASKS